MHRSQLHGHKLAARLWEAKGERKHGTAVHMRLATWRHTEAGQTPEQVRTECPLAAGAPHWGRCPSGTESRKYCDRKINQTSRACQVQRRHGCGAAPRFHAVLTHWTHSSVARIRHLEVTACSRGVGCLATYRRWCSRTSSCTTHGSRTHTGQSRFRVAGQRAVRGGGAYI